MKRNKKRRKNNLLAPFSLSLLYSSKKKYNSSNNIGGQGDKKKQTPLKRNLFPSEILVPPRIFISNPFIFRHFVRAPFLFSPRLSRRFLLLRVVVLRFRGRPVFKGSKRGKGNAIQWRGRKYNSSLQSYIYILLDASPRCSAASSMF